MNDNGDCSLPCWWGITPGITSWKDARAFLQTISSGVIGASERHHYTFSYPFPEGPPGNSIEASFIYDDNDIIIEMDVWLTAFNFNLSGLLARVGKPDKVYLQTYTFMPEPPLPFNLLLEFDDLHMTAEFYSSATQRNDILVGCVNRGTPRLVLYAPSIDVATELKKMFEGTESGGWASFRSLEDSTAYSNEFFYQTFGNPNNTRCLETPSSLWELEW